MEFTDGMKFNLDGPYRVVRRSDGWYVLGNGLLCPVDSYEDGRKFIEEMKSIRT